MRRAIRRFSFTVCLPLRAALGLAVQRRAVPRLAGALALGAAGAEFAALFAFRLRMEAPESSAGGGGGRGGTTSGRCTRGCTWRRRRC